MTAKEGSPFDCDSCTEHDQVSRNCSNLKGLTESARAVEAYTPDVVAEHADRYALKVFRLGGLRLYECPISYVTIDTAEMMRLVYLMAGSQGLLHAGGWGDQPYWLVEAYEIYHAESAAFIEDKNQ